jgi:hypothetical protein
VLVAAVMMEAAGTSEMSVNFYQTTWRSNPEDSYFQVVSFSSLRLNQSLFRWALGVFNRVNVKLDGLLPYFIPFTFTSVFLCRFTFVLVLTERISWSY